MAIDPKQLKAWFDSHPSRFKAFNLQPDGYPPTGELWNILRHPTSMRKNPASAPQIPKPFTAADLLGKVSAGNRVKLMQAGLVGPVQHSIENGDGTGLAMLAQLAADAGIITPAELSGVMAVVTATQDDPEYQADLPATDLETQFGVVDIDDQSIKADIAAALGRAS